MTFLALLESGFSLKLLLNFKPRELLKISLSHFFKTVAYKKNWLVVGKAWSYSYTIWSGGQKSYVSEDTCRVFSLIYACAPLAFDLLLFMMISATHDMKQMTAEVKRRAADK